MRSNDLPQMFLCSHCKTEQPVSSIGHNKNTLCLCPHCGENCCQDFCTILKTGKWNPPRADVFLHENLFSEEDWTKARAEYVQALQEFYARYERTRTEYERENLIGTIEILTEAIERLENSISEEEEQK